MNNIIQQKELYEVDPNSSFNKLKKLQLALKEEVALSDIYFENRDNLLKKIDKNCFIYFQKRMSIQEIFDHVNLPLEDNDKKKKIKYIVSEKPQNELTQCYDPLYKLMFYFRDSNELLMKLIEHCPKENYEQLANLLCNYFFVNIFTSSFLNENLLTLIYLLLEKEVDKINTISSSISFLDSTQNFTAKLLRSLARKDEVKVYLEKILKKLIIKTSGMLRGQNNNLFIELNISKINNILANGNYNFERTQKEINSIRELITSNINKSRLNFVKKNDETNEDKSELNNENNKILSNAEIENNIWVQVTKETFDDLLLGNEAKENFDNLFYNKKQPKTNNDDLENYFINSGYFIKKENPEVPKKKDKQKMRATMAATRSKIELKDNNKNDINKENKKLIMINPIEENKEKNENNEDLYETVEEKGKEKDNINELYLKELNKETLYDLLEKQTNKDMEEYILNQIKLFEKEGASFSNEKLINEIAKYSNIEKTREQLALAFKYNFEFIKDFLDEIFFSLIKNIDNIPYLIRAVCTILAKLIKIKFPKITMIQIIPFLSEFIFTNLIFPILVNPKINGIMMFDFSKDTKLNSERNKKIITMNKILKKLMRGQLYNNSDNEYCYTLFNYYFIEIMPYIIDFFTKLMSVKLPTNIEQLLEEKKALSQNILKVSKTLQQENINSELQKNSTFTKENKISKEFNFLKMHPEERIELQSLCINFKDILMI